jgi:formimidoylglutamate deiminase
MLNTAMITNAAHSSNSSELWAPRAWLDGRWANDVLFAIDQRGAWSSISVNVARDIAVKRSAHCISQPLIPGLINAHSHAFQRAFAGLAERLGADQQRDDFWSWRDRMYRTALAMSPLQLRAIATQLYVELLRGGYTHVCEFHYLHHDADGRAYADPFDMSQALIEAAGNAGIGLTLLPVLYERAGFSAPQLRDDQRRFAASADWVIAAQQYVGEKALSNASPLNAGVAIHSLRAATEPSMRWLVDRANGPIHIHVAEQQDEVVACIRATGLRPVQWLARHHALDRRWQLIHATHVTQSEINAVAQSGASVVLCPTTEANLGDGLTDVAAWFNAGTSLAIGSDSHVTRDWREELRWLEYGQRLQHRARNVIAFAREAEGATAARLLDRTLTGGAASAGASSWGFVVGARADALAINTADNSLIGVPDSHTLDAMIFSSPASLFRDVMVAGRWVISDGNHDNAKEISTAFTLAMEVLWRDLR